MQNPIEIITSIVPGPRLDIQIAALETWRSCGFDVLSFNAPGEIEILAASFPEVRFVAPPRDATRLVGRPLIFLSDILQHLASSGAGIGGIINSDIMFSPDKGLGDFIKNQAANAFVFGPRLDVVSPDDPTGKLDLFGFDYFIFDRSLQLGWEQSNFCLGMPFWDHWLPLIAILGGHRVKKILSPIARHVLHPVAWDNDTLAFNDQFVRILIDRQNQLPAHKTTAANQPAADFRSIEIEQKYFQLRAKIQQLNDASAPQSETMESLEDLARHFDNVTKAIIRFLDRHSEIITFEPVNRLRE